MAKATLDTRTVPVTTYKTEQVVTLTLSLDEAETLHAIHMSVGGDPDYSRRAHMDAIGRALHDAGVFGVTENEPTFEMEPMKRSIYFKKQPKKYSA